MRKLIVLRGIFGCFCNVTFMLGIALLPLSQGIVIYMTMPLFTALLGRIFLSEKLSIFDCIGMIIAFIGIIFLQNPLNSTLNKSYDHPILGTLITIVSAILSACSSITIRTVQKRGQIHFLVLPLAFGVVNVLMSPFFMVSKSLFVETTTSTYTVEKCIVIVLISFFTFL